ncbi:hypothetical protein J5N97_024235 [Dioscorea zingiberensis]|uniref:Uncharacterized protein n=1 Tax=Dioscorea zingiberensis TaxID=325984 RepID=A0A9D5C6V3_9LILI|nr:hypothetical protein J5N97_024235 [Dioscorea zingiberensis]
MYTSSIKSCKEQHSKIDLTFERGLKISIVIWLTLAINGINHQCCYIASGNNESKGALLLYLQRVWAFQGLVAFMFSFSIAFMMRCSVKLMTIFRKMEEQVRLFILTLCLQVFKTLNLLFLIIHVVSLGYVVGLVVESLVYSLATMKTTRFSKISFLLNFTVFVHLFICIAYKCFVILILRLNFAVIL